MLADLRDFSGAVLDHWLDMAGGGVVAILGWWVWPYICKELGHRDWVDAVPSPLIWAAIAAGIFSAFFKAWRSERREKIDARTRLKELSEPNLQARIEEFGVGDGSIDGMPHGQSQAACMAVVTIWNLGAPSIADSFSVNVRFSDGRRYELVLFAVPGPIRFMTLTVMPSDMIFEKALCAPLQYGARIRGYLFAVPKPTDSSYLSKSVILTPGNILEISFVDVKGKRITVSDTVTEMTTGQPKLYPGAFNVAR